MPPRPEVRTFLDRCAPGARIEAVAGDVSSRKFYRIYPQQGETLILMDYGRPFAGASDDMLLGAIFRRAGLPVAEIREAAGDVGCVLLEDLGPDTLQSVLEGAIDRDRRLALLEEAARLAARVAARGTPVLAGCEELRDRTLDAERFRFEMDYFLQHFVAGFRGRADAPPALRDRLYELADAIDQPAFRVFCHRDFHSRNLIVVSDDRLAMVDIQDARLGPDSYDLASLIRDAYIDVDEAEVVRLIETFLDELPDSPDAETFSVRLRRVQAQRMIKALGTFGFQVSVRQAKAFRVPISRTLARLRSTLRACEETRPLSDLLVREGLLEDP